MGRNEYYLPSWASNSYTCFIKVVYLTPALNPPFIQLCLKPLKPPFHRFLIVKINTDFCNWLRFNSMKDVRFAFCPLSKPLLSRSRLTLVCPECTNCIIHHALGSTQSSLVLGLDILKYGCLLLGSKDFIVTTTFFADNTMLSLLLPFIMTTEGSSDTIRFAFVNPSSSSGGFIGVFK